MLWVKPPITEMDLSIPLMRLAATQKTVQLTLLGRRWLAEIYKVPRSADCTGYLNSAARMVHDFLIVPRPKTCSYHDLDEQVKVDLRSASLGIIAALSLI